MVRAALDKVPALNYRIDDLMMGCGPARPGESGFSIARVVAVAGSADSPGTTVSPVLLFVVAADRSLPRDQAGRGRRVSSRGREPSPSSPETQTLAGRRTAVRQGSGTAPASADRWHDPAPIRSCRTSI